MRKALLGQQQPKADPAKMSKREESKYKINRRLDATVYRMKLAPTPFAARQMVSHGHVLVNDRRVNISSYQLRDGDTIELKQRAKEMVLVLEAVRSSERDVPDYVEIDHDRMR